MDIAKLVNRVYMLFVFHYFTFIICFSLTSVITNWYRSFVFDCVRKMPGMKVKIDKFTWRNSISLWQIKMRALLKQQGLWALLTKKSTDLVTAEMTTME